MPKPKAKELNATTVWVVMHYEYLSSGNIDCVQYHVASSLTAAKRYIKKWIVMPYSWWQIHPHMVDHNIMDGDEGTEVHFFDYKGKPMKKADYQRAWRAFESAKKRGEFDVPKN